MKKGGQYKGKSQIHKKNDSWSAAWSICPVLNEKELASIEAVGNVMIYPA
jgi:hypothetical protein